MPPAKKEKSTAASSRRIPKKMAKKAATAKRSPKAAEPKKTEVKISAAKGRPMLIWVGKHPLQRVTVFPAQLIEKFDPVGELEKKQTGGLLFHGDNKEVLAYLLANGYRRQVDLIYIDPPFNAGVDYIRKVTLRGLKMDKIQGEGYGLLEQVQYANNWFLDAYLQSIYERLQLAKELLKDDGIIFIRLDVHFGYCIRMIADEIFGTDMFQNELIVNRIKKNVTEKGRRTIPNAVDYVYVYFKSPAAEYRTVLRKLPRMKPGYWHNMDSPGIPGPRSLSLGGKVYFPGPGAHLKFTQAQAQEMWDKGLIREHQKSGALEYWVPDRDYENLDSDWTDIPGYAFKTGYPTENSEQLLERIVLAGSEPGDLVLDFYLGSGTTADVAQKLGRKWIGCDINKGSIQTSSKRLQNTIAAQIEASNTESKQGRLVELDGDYKPLKPTQYSFAVYRVNDYDLQIQHNEAVNLACEHIGIKRTTSDLFFDGNLGKKLVKIIPFNHPLSPVDLEEIKKELDARPDDERDVVVVSLGKELAVDSWLEDWNRYRKNRNVPNRIEVIELRTDERYGKFFEHKPARARVEIKRVGEKITIRIVEFISPTILERLEQQAGVFTPHIEDWRSMVDSIMIDTAYNGQVFNVVYSDVPERKSDLVVGEYELDAPKKKTTVAVKITDMLGEEVLETRQI
jgi:DNA modification methylase